ncbi:origin recognition complex subunit 5 [Oratosquilla oratoria]|uniref:origin recognition complex subunit 5 n=1 Tax=Oratosquilla oratoria TaxID=337810 RepID=UPI003F77787C
MTGTGKTFITKSVLSTLEVTVSHVDCVEFYSSRMLYETVLNQLAGAKLTKENRYCGYASCDNMGDFVKHIQDIGARDKNSRMAIVMEQSDRLRDCDANILPGLCRLQELSGVNICIIFTSMLPFDKFRPSTGVLDPITIHFPQYSKDELVQIFMLECPAEHSEAFYHNYVSLLLSVFYLATKNLQELRHLIQMNFPKYCEPVLRGEVETHDVRRLWRGIEPHLKKALSTVYLRQVSSAQFEKMQQLIEYHSGEKSTVQSSGTTKVELPFYSKFLLVSAYLASYNPARTDRRFFLKNHGKQRKTQAAIKAKERSSNQLVGPKPFPLDRLLAIFYSIVEDKVSPSANIFAQIATLVSIQLITQVGEDEDLDSPKYRCNVNLDFIRGIARTINFDIIRYLYDFA